jgi:hypothetical protein
MKDLPLERKASIEVWLIALRLSPLKQINFAEDISASKQGLTTPDAVSTLPTIIRGDWVLFHPVYSPEELKAVEVLSTTFSIASLPVLNVNLSGAPKGSENAIRQDCV